MNRIRFERELEDKKMVKTLKHLIVASKEIGVGNFDAHGMTLHLRKFYGIVVDWHITSDMLDDLSRTDQLEHVRVNHLGMNLYKFMEVSNE